MRRMYNIESYMNIVERFKSRIPEFNFTTDVIVGFPGETEDDFQKTCFIVKD